MITFQICCFITLILLTDCNIRFIKIQNGTLVIIRENSEAFLFCRVKGEAVAYRWAKRNENGTLDHIPRSNDERLTFTKVQQKDSGNYVCQAYSSYEKEWRSSKDSHVDVVTRRDVASVEIFNSSRLEIHLHRTDINLICHAQGRHVIYQWARRPLWGNLEVIAHGRRLQFDNFTRSLAGVYICQARSENQSYWVNSTNVEITWLSDKTTYAKILNGTYAAVLDGSISKYLLCNANGYLTEYQWVKIDFWHNEQLIPESNNSTLYLRNVNRYHEERYVCKAKGYGQEKWIESTAIYVKVITNKPIVRVVNGTLILIPEGTSKSFLQCESEEDVLDYRWIKYRWQNPATPVERCNNSNQCEFPEFEQKFAGKYACQIKIIAEDKEEWMSSSFSDVRVLYMFNSGYSHHTSVLLIIIMSAVVIFG